MNNKDRMDKVPSSSRAKDEAEIIPVSELELSARAYNALRLNRIHSLSQILGKTVEELMELDYVNRTVAEEIILCCRDYEPERTEVLPTITEIKDSTDEEIAHLPDDMPQLDEAAEPELEVPESVIQAILEAKPIPIEELELSTRSYNALKRVKLNSVQDLVGKTEEEIFSLRNLGAKSAKEIVRTVRRYVASSRWEREEEEPEEEEAAETAEAVADERPIELLNLSVRSYNALKRVGIHTIQQLLDLNPEELSKIKNLGKKSLEELQTVRKNHTPLLKKTSYSVEELLPLVLNAVTTPFQGLSFQEIQDALPEAVEAGIIKHAVGILLANHKLEYVDFRCYRVYPSYYEVLDSYVKTIPERERTVMLRRYSGDTLEAIARDLGITRERVRQIQTKQNIKLRAAYRKETGLTAFDEDFYEALYTRCDLPDAFWTEELGLPKRAIDYLSFTFKRGTGRPEDVLNDEEIPVSLRYRVRSFLDRDKVRLDGNLFPRIRSEIEAYALQKYARDEIVFDRFVELYNGMLETNGIPFDEKLYYTESSIRSRSSHFAESPLCLWKQGGRLRYYDIQSRDYAELLDTLHLDCYQNTEVSTRKFMNLYPGLMERYEIRDPYELHNLLKKIAKTNGLEGVTFSRQPVLQFGECDRVKTILEILEEFSPMTLEELTDYLSQEYGIEGGMIPHAALKNYYHQGVYSVDFKRIPEQSVEELRKAMTQDFYYLEELRALYTTTFPNADSEEINPRSLKTLGMVVNSQYAVRNFPSAEAYFRQLLTKDEVYDVSEYLKRYGTIQLFNQLYAELLQAHQIFRFERNQIVTLRRLERLQVTMETVEDYCAAVQDFAEQESYFTIFSLRQDGFHHALDSLGFDDYFYASLLGADERFSAQRVYGQLVLFNGRVFGQFSTTEFLLAQLREYESIDLDTFLQDMEERFDVHIPTRYEVTAAVKGSELYYDNIMDKVYRDKALYYADLDE